MENILKSGSDAFDKLLDGGYEKGVLTTIFGPAGSGKTTSCLLAAISASESGKIIFIDTEGGFSTKRMSQLTDEYKKILPKIILMQPTNYVEQVKALEKLPKMLSEKFSLVVCDTITALYRTERSPENKDLVKTLARQIGVLLETARTKNIPVIMTTQVYSDFENKDGVKIVGGDTILYSSKCLLELQNFADSARKAVLRKHRHIAEKEITYKIVEKGFVEA